MTASEIRMTAAEITAAREHGRVQLRDLLTVDVDANGVTMEDWRADPKRVSIPFDAAGELVEAILRWFPQIKDRIGVVIYGQLG